MSIDRTRGLRVVVGADDAGVDYKEALADQLRTDPRVAEVIDVGVGREEHTPYPTVAIEASRRVAAGEADRGLLVCGTGLGMAITANKTPGVRAAVGHDIFSVERSVLSNDAQVLTMGQRVIGLELARRLVDRWLDLTFDAASPSAPKVELIRRYERDAGTAGEATPCEAPAEAPSPAETTVARTVVVGSASGMHARPAKLFADRARGTGHEVTIAKGDGPPAPAGSVLGVMSLGAFRGDEVTITVTGPRATEVADELAAMAASNLDEA